MYLVFPYRKEMVSLLMMDQLRVGTAKSNETSENEKGPKCCSRTILIRECGKLCKITLVLLYFSLWLILRTFLTIWSQFDTAIFTSCFNQFFFPLSSQQPLVFSSAFVGCYDYFSFGFTALNQSAFNFFKIMSSLGNQYQYLDPTAEEMDNGFVFSPVSLISSFSTIFVKPFFGSHNRWSIII